MVQYHCTVTSLFDVSPATFYPPQSELEHCEVVPYKTIPHHAKDYNLLPTVKQAFSQRRKTLATVKIATDEDWKRIDVDSHLRESKSVLGNM